MSHVFVVGLMMLLLIEEMTYLSPAHIYHHIFSRSDQRHTSDIRNGSQPPGITTQHLCFPV